MKKLTIGMSVYDDFDGVYFTIQALRLYHLKHLDIDTEFIVIDNNPNSPSGAETKIFVESWARGKYIPYTDRISPTSRDEVFKHATGDYTLCIDCHILLKDGALQHLINYYKANPDTTDLIQGPLMYDDFNSYFTHFQPVWGSGMYGIWGTDTERHDIGEPFEIPMQGMGLFSCKTSEWPGYSPFFKGFGAEEGYIHEKFRRKGSKCLCIPQLKWVHRFGRPKGVPFPNTWEDRVWNYFVGWLEILKDPESPFINDIKREFSKILPEQTVLHIFEEAKNRVL